jgi:hypothetical protein
MALRVSSVGTATRLWFQNRGIEVRFSAGGREFSPSCSFQTDFVTYQQVTRAYIGRCVKLTIHLCLMPRLRKRGNLSPLPYTSSWRADQLSTGKLYLLSFFFFWYLEMIRYVENDIKLFDISKIGSSDSIFQESNLSRSNFIMSVTMTCCSGKHSNWSHLLL